MTRYLFICLILLSSGFAQEATEDDSNDNWVSNNVSSLYESASEMADAANDAYSPYADEIAGFTNADEAADTLDPSSLNFQANTVEAVLGVISGYSSYKLIRGQSHTINIALSGESGILGKSGFINALNRGAPDAVANAVGEVEKKIRNALGKNVHSVQIKFAGRRVVAEGSVSEWLADKFAGKSFKVSEASTRQPRFGYGYPHPKGAKPGYIQLDKNRHIEYGSKEGGTQIVLPLRKYGPRFWFKRSWKPYRYTVQQGVETSLDDALSIFRNDLRILQSGNVAVKRKIKIRIRKIKTPFRFGLLAVSSVVTLATSAEIINDIYIAYVQKSKIKDIDDFVQDVRENGSDEQLEDEEDIYDEFFAPE